jgi:hypothetical protein
MARADINAYRFYEKVIKVKAGITAIARSFRVPGGHSRQTSHGAGSMERDAAWGEHPRLGVPPGETGKGIRFLPPSTLPCFSSGARRSQRSEGPAAQPLCFEMSDHDFRLAQPLVVASQFPIFAVVRSPALPGFRACVRDAIWSDAKNTSNRADLTGPSCRIRFGRNLLFVRARLSTPFREPKSPDSAARPNVS